MNSLQSAPNVEASYSPQPGLSEAVEPVALSTFVRGKNNEANLPVDELREVFRYDETTGLLYWKSSPGKRATVGRVAGWVDQKGYRRVRYKGLKYLVHRIVWMLNTGEWPVNLIDHSKRNSGNNKIEHLRGATHSQNFQNQGLRRNNTSGLKGVSWVNRDSRWIAHASINGREKHLGYLTDKSLAALAVDLSNLTNHGEFAVLNDEAATIRALFSPPSPPPTDGTI
jgi:hypothetical protein